MPTADLVICPCGCGELITREGLVILTGTLTTPDPLAPIIAAMTYSEPEPRTTPKRVGVAPRLRSIT